MHWKDPGKKQVEDTSRDLLVPSGVVGDCTITQPPFPHRSLVQKCLDLQTRKIFSQNAQLFCHRVKFLLASAKHSFAPLDCQVARRDSSCFPPPQLRRVSHLALISSQGKFCGFQGVLGMIK